MKLLKMLIVVFTFSMVGLILSSCGGVGNADTETVKEGKEYTSAYICPMHCEGSGSATAGTCPVCKMDYVARAEEAGEYMKGHDHESHDHNHDHGHEH